MKAGKATGKRNFRAGREPGKPKVADVHFRTLAVDVSRKEKSFEVLPSFIFCCIEMEAKF